MPTYLDHAATTPLDPEVLEVMLPYLREEFGNPSSVHVRGRAARHAVEEARRHVAQILNCEPEEVIFTSGGTEANALAIHGVLDHPECRGDGFVTSAIEHDAVLQCARRHEKSGGYITRVRPDSTGHISVESVESAVADDTGLVSVMWVNNELGTINPIREIAQMCRDRGIPFHTDAVQARGFYPLDVQNLGVDLLTLSGHKIYGPKGVGVLFVRKGTALQSLVTGGGQERKRRGGTENVAAIVGFAEALRRVVGRRMEDSTRIALLRNRLATSILEKLGSDIIINTPLDNSAPHILNLSIPPKDGRPIDGEMLLLGLDLQGVMASAGSACASGAVEPSHVLAGIGLPPETAQASVRLSLGRNTTEDDINKAVDVLTDVVNRQRATR